MKLRAALSLQQIGDLKKIAEEVGGEEAKSLNKPALMDLVCRRFALTSVVESRLAGLNDEGKKQQKVEAAVAKEKQRRQSPRQKS